MHECIHTHTHTNTYTHIHTHTHTHTQNMHSCTCSICTSTHTHMLRFKGKTGRRGININTWINTQTHNQQSNRKKGSCESSAQAYPRGTQVRRENTVSATIFVCRRFTLEVPCSEVAGIPTRMRCSAKEQLICVVFLPQCVGQRDGWIGISGHLSHSLFLATHPVLRHKSVQVGH